MAFARGTAEHSQHLKSFSIINPAVLCYGRIGMQFTIEIEQEEDGRWIAEVSELSGVMKYGSTRDSAIARAEALALRVLAERIEAGEQPVEPIHVVFAAV